MNFGLSAGLLMLALGGALLMPARLLALWALCFVTWWILALYSGHVGSMGAFGIGLLATCSWMATTSSHAINIPFLRRTATVAALLIAVLLASHQWPGFDNPQLLSNIIITSDAAPFTLWLSFDKAAAGFLILVFFCAQAGNGKELSCLTVAARTLYIGVITIGVVMGLAILLDVIRWEPKLPSFFPAFLITNLMFACLTEEVFFRGVIQVRLQHYLIQKCISPLWGAGLSIAATSILFALAHSNASAAMLLLTFFASLGYGVAYVVTQSLAASVLVHFFLNAVHFIFFTYPKLAEAM